MIFTFPEFYLLPPLLVGAVPLYRFFKPIAVNGQRLALQGVGNH